MTILKKKRVLAAKIETTVGTAETLSGADGAFNAYEVMIQPTIEVESREGQGAFGKLSGVPSARTGTVTFRTDCWWDGTTTMPKWAATLLPGCGVVEASQVYTPRSEAPGSNVKTLTIAVYEDGLIKKIHGAVGTFKITAVAGKMVSIEWTFTGLWNPPVDGALIAPTYPTARPIRYASATTAYNSESLCVESFTFDIGNNIVPIECGDTPSGYDYYIIVDRNPVITVNPESVLVATKDRFGAWLAATEAEFTCAFAGSASNETLEFSAPKAQITNIQEGDRNSLQVDDITLSCNKNGSTADEEFSLTFTEAA